MKSITYNPSNAKSILLAAVFFGKHPEAKIKTSDSKGTDFDSKLEEDGIKTGYAYTLLHDYPHSDAALALEHGIVSNHHDIENFDNLMLLRKIFEGNKDVIVKVSAAGKSVVSYKNSPAHKAHLSKEIEEQDVDTENTYGDRVAKKNEDKKENVSKPADEEDAESSDVKE